MKKNTKETMKRNSKIMITGSMPHTWQQHHVAHIQLNRYEQCKEIAKKTRTKDYNIDSEQTDWITKYEVKPK